MALEDVEVDFDDDTLTIIPTIGNVESGNTVSLAVGKVRAGAGVRHGSVMSEKGQFQKKEKQKTSKVWNDFVSVKIVGVKKYSAIGVRNCLLLANLVLP